MNTTNSRVTAGFAEDVREMLHLDTLDSLWLSGTLVRDWGSSLARANELIKDPSRCLMYRYLMRHPHRNPLPALPAPADTAELVKEVWPKFKVRRLGQIFGASDWVGYSWTSGAEASPVIRRLSYIISTAIQEEGVAGFEDYLEVVEEEARARGFPALSAVFAHGWQARTENPKGVDADAAKPPRVTAGYVEDLRETLHLDTQGSVWLSGTLVRSWGSSQRRASDLINDPARCILYRYLTRYPHRCPLPTLPIPKEVLQSLVPVWADVNPKHFGHILGGSDWAGLKWASNGRGTPAVRRLGYLLLMAIKEEGAAGFEDYLAVVKEEARSRGFADLHELFKKGWRIRSEGTDVRRLPGGGDVENPQV